ncbi:MAG: cellulase family glycosylhydrolase [Gaiellaceae bacterium]
MQRPIRLIFFACLLGLLLPPLSAAAASRMYIGFQDDPSFRFREPREANLNEAQRAAGTIVRTQVTWSRVAFNRPSNATNPFDPAYELSDVDELIRNAQRRGMEVLLSIYGTPAWANGNEKANRAPTRMSDLTDFARALASRYSGRFAGYPYVRFYSVWNEPNLAQFLSPQFSSSGASLAPAIYARLYRAAYTGIKAGNSRAVVGIGETSARGHDKPTTVVQHSHSPGKFAQLVAKADPNLRFDGWAEHPYPFTPSQPPTARVRLPNVSLTQLPEFQKIVDKAFGRKDTPIWVTEYSHETRPEEPKGVSYGTQTAYARQALNIAKGYSFVPIFIWFVLRDDPSNPWQSGLLRENGARKPSFGPFSAAAKLLDARNAIVYVKAGKPNPLVRVSVLELAGRSGTGTRLGVTYKVIFKKTVVDVRQPAPLIDSDGWVTLKLRFTPAAGRSYRMTVDAGDASNNHVARALTLVSVR